MISMTSSKGPFHPMFHDAVQVLRQGAGVWLAAITVFCALIPIPTAAFPGSSIFNVEHTHQQLKFRLIAAEFVGGANTAAMLYGLTLGLVLFRFVLERQRVTVYFGLGLSRRKLFLIRYGLGMLLLASGLAVPLTVSFGLNLAALGAGPGLGESTVFLWAGLTLLALSSFTMGALGCLLAGSLGEAVSLALSLLGGITAALYSVNALMEVLLWGNAFGAVTYGGTDVVSPGLLERFSPLNPLLFFLRPSQDAALFYRSLTQTQPGARPWGLCLGWAAAVLALALLALLAMTHRRAEQAGVTGASLPVQALPLFLCSFLAGALTLRFTMAHSRVLAYGAAAGVFAGVHILLRLMGLSTRRGWRYDLAQTGAQMAVAAAMVLVLTTGGLGYQKRVPDAAGVEAVTLSYQGSPNYLGGAVTGSSSGKGYYLRSSYTYTAREDILTVLELHRSFQSTGERPLEGDPSSAGQTVLPCDIQISYTLRGGGELTRYYDRASLDQLTAMLQLDESTAVRAAVDCTIQGLDEEGKWAEAHTLSAAAAYRYGGIYISDRWYAAPYSITLSEGQRTELLAAIAADVGQQTTAQRYAPQSPPVGVILFSRNGERDSRSFAYELGSALVYVTDDFSNTLDFLDKHGLRELMEFRGEIESVTLQAYDPYGGINRRKTPYSSYFMAYRTGSADSYLVEEDFGRKRPITDTQKLAELTSLLQNSYFMNDGGYLAAVKLAGEETYVYQYLPASRVPEFVTGKGN